MVHRATFHRGGITRGRKRRWSRSLFVGRMVMVLPGVLLRLGVRLPPRGIAGAGVAPVINAARRDRGPTMLPGVRAIIGDLLGKRRRREQDTESSKDKKLVHHDFPIQRSNL
jgi:hypothetical protein